MWRERERYFSALPFYVILRVKINTYLIYQLEKKTRAEENKGKIEEEEEEEEK